MPRTQFPIIGFAFEVQKRKIEEIDKWLHEVSKNFEDGIFRTWLGMTTIHVNKQEYAEIILRDTKQITKAHIYRYFEPWFGLGLVNSSGIKWAHDRKLITPSFHFGILEEFAEVMVEKATILNKKTALGMNIHAQDDIESDYIQAARTLTDSITARIFRPWLKFDFIYYLTARGKNFQKAVDIAHDKCNRVIEYKKKERERKSKMNHLNLDTTDDITGKKKRRAFLDLLFEASENNERPLTMDEIRDHVNTFMSAGHDTTSALISWTLFCIGNEIDVQNKLHKELDEVLGDRNEVVTTKDVSKMKYLHRVIKEVLRLYPSVTRVARYITEDMQFGKYTVPAGCNLTLHINQIHMDPNLWPNPTKFDPDRFLPENSINRNPYAYIPFSAGPRNCIGQKYAQLEAKMVLTEILRKWKVTRFAPLTYNSNLC
ncbi:cytochrome P450 4C1-like [Aphidius gifuensis]|uniref:cytochrome P450 4C1-like n=1 Tax=Aphidius gifuensis TaxID=684658 RepID=UPI001CDCDAEA|nr:cytochrome P450 4C1-like [Aphidius gifuensis]